MESSDPLIGKEIGKCLVQRKLGQGGMGTVYLAQHPGLKKAVALKILPRELASDPAFIERFLREARLAARLEHPNVVQVFDVGEDQGVYYISMQYVEGKSLDAWLKERKKLPAGEAISLTKRVAVALGAAAKLGIVHRDIKPHNILISKEGIVKVADFGLAKDNDANRSISEPGVVMGTPYYMSPEQAKGEPVDPRGDIYSLGATLYHMLTGKRMFEGGSPVSIVLKQINEQPVPARDVEPTIPEAVDALLRRMIDKDPAKRFATPDELVKAIDALKQPGGATMGAALPLPPKRKAAMIALPVAGILIVGIVLGLILGKGKPVPPPVPPAPPVVVVPPAKPVPSPTPTPAPVPAPGPSSRENILSKFKDAQEKRWTEEVMARTDEFLTALQKRDYKTAKSMMDTLAYGDLSEAQVAEIFTRITGDKATLERWEFEDVDVRTRMPGRPQPHALTTLTYEMKFPKGEMKIQDQTIHWIRRLDGKWLVTKAQRPGK